MQRTETGGTPEAVVMDEQAIVRGLVAMCRGRAHQGGDSEKKDGKMGYRKPKKEKGGARRRNGNESSNGARRDHRQN